MQGTWGRRIFGRIWTEDGIRRFKLQMDTRDGDVLTAMGHAVVKDINENPWMYKHILDELVKALEHKVARSNNTP